MNTHYVLIDFENVQLASLELLTAEYFKVVVFVGASQNRVPFEVAAALQEFGVRAKYVKVSAKGPNALDFHIAYYLGRLAAAEPTAHFHVISKDTGFDPLVEHLRSQQISVRRVASIAGTLPVEAPAKPVAQSTMSGIPQMILGLGVTLPQPAVIPTSSTAIALPARAAIQSATKPVCLRSVNAVTRPAVIVAVQPTVNVTSKPMKAKSFKEQLAVIVARLRKVPSNRPRTIEALCHSIKSWLGQQVSEAEVAKLVQSLKSQKYLRVTDAKKLEYEFAQRSVASTSGLTQKVKTTLPST